MGDVLNVESRPGPGQSQLAPHGVLANIPPLPIYRAYPRRKYQKPVGQPRLHILPEGATAYYFPGAYDPMVEYPGFNTFIRRTVRQNVCVENWDM